jgi:hypothetical protein
MLSLLIASSLLVAAQSFVVRPTTLLSQRQQQHTALFPSLQHATVLAQPRFGESCLFAATEVQREDGSWDWVEEGAEQEEGEQKELLLDFAQLQPFLKIAVPFFKNDKRARESLIGIVALTLLNSGVSVAFSVRAS